MDVTTYESFSEISASETTPLITAKNGNHSDFSARIRGAHHLNLWQLNLWQ
jgi:hypothetical protein